MSVPYSQRAIEVFEAALDIGQGERAAFLDEACRDCHELRAEVESLLRADEQADGFLEPPAQAARQTPEDDPLIGSHIGRYKIQSVIATGGMGTVYEALQQEPRRIVALKLIRPGMASRSALRRFRHESEILGRLRHPGIAQIYEAGTHGGDGGAPYFAMEFIPGARPITRYVAEEHLSTRERLALFTSVCEAVHAGHQRGIIHRDLKPANILVDEHGQPKLIDYGVARATDADLTIATLQTDVGQLIGTLRYMSPEQCDGDAIELDTRSDVYSLGVVLFELLTGELPYDFGSSSPFDIPRVIREQEPRRVSKVNRVLRGDIETVVLKALDKDRGQRYQSVPELTRDIQHYLNHEPIEARHGRRWYVLRKTLQRHYIAVTVAGAFMLVVTGSALGLAILYHDSEQQRITAEQRSEELRRAVYLNNITLAHRAYEAGDCKALRLHLANCPDDLRRWEWHYLNRLADTSLRTLEGHTGPVNAVAVSPDGRLFASGSWDRTLRLWDGATGAELLTLPADGYVEQVSFSPDGRLVAGVGRGSSEAVIWNTTTGERVEMFSIPTNHAVAFSPDGRYIAAGGYGHEHLRVWNVNTGALVREWPDIRRSRPLRIAWSPDSGVVATARENGVIVLLDVESERTIREFEGHNGDVKNIAFSPDGRLLASTSYDTTLRVWRIDSGETVHVFDKTGHAFNAAAFSPDSTRVAAVDSSSLLMWDVVGGGQEAVRLGHGDVINTVAFTPDGRHLVTAGYDNLLKVWDAAPATEPPGSAISNTQLASVVVSKDGEWVAVGDIAGQAYVLDTSRRRETLCFGTVNGGARWPLAFGPAGRYLAVGEANGRIHIRERPFDTPLTSMQASKTAVTSLGWAPDDDTIASGHSDGVVRVWDIETGEAVCAIDAHDRNVNSVTFSPNGDFLVTAGASVGARVWDARTWEHVRDLPTGMTRCIATVSHSGRLVAAGTDGMDVWLWELETGELLWRGKGHLSQIQDLAFMPDDQRLVSCCYNGLIKIWDVETGEPALTLRQQDAPLRALAVSPDGRWFASAGLDRSLRIWGAGALDGTEE